MESIRAYKCPCCGAPLAFDGKDDQLHCGSCENTFPVETVQEIAAAEGDAEAVSAYNWEAYTPRTYAQDEAESLASYACRSCGAEISGGSTVGASVCPYCGNTSIIKGQFAGSLRPDYVVPFKVSREEAMQHFTAAAGRAPFLPDEFKSRRIVETLTGMYVPFWMFDCDCEAAISYRAERVRFWSDANFNYTKTDHYKLLRNGGIGFANIPVDGSKKADNTYMEALEPFDLSEAMDFNTAYLSGYFADKYDVTAEESIPRANERVKNSTEAVFAGTAAGYTGLRTEHSSIRFENGKVRYALLPVWMLHIRYGDAVYAYAINGQTGKTVGEYPICKKKRNRYFAKTYGILLAAAAVIGACVLFL